MRSRHPKVTRTTTLSLLVLLSLGCPKANDATDAGHSVFYTNIKKGLTMPEQLAGDGGGAVVTFAAASTVSLWAVNRRALKDVLWAVHLQSGESLARALEKQPAVPPEMVAHARAVKGREPVSEPAEKALTGPLSLPFGGVHAPVKLEDAGLTTGATDECKDTLLRPGAVGQVLAGVGRTRILMLLDGEDLKRFAGCVEKAPLPADAPGPVVQERTRLSALLEQGKKEEVAILMALGVDG